MKVASSNYHLPPCSDLLLLRTSPAPRRPSVLDVHNLLSSPPYKQQVPLKAKRKRASPSQLSVLNQVFGQTYFPSTELRIELGKQLGMSPRAVQIWFQNKRQSLRTRERQQQEKQKPAAGQPYYTPYQHTTVLPPISPPLSPPEHHLASPSIHHRQYFSLPPLQLPSTPTKSSVSASSSSSSYPSPTSIDSIILH